MLEKLEIENFQSHEKTTVALHPGVNVFVGPSDNGKSAILRALGWLFQNKPDGLGFVSHWNLNEKGLIKRQTAVGLWFDEGKELWRYRTKDANGYAVGEKELEAIGRDVPDEVIQLLDIADVNIQSQLAPHFLLSDSAGEVARIFNKTIRLDDIDKLLALVEQKKRATRNGLERIEISLSQLNADADKLNWIEACEELIQKARALQEATAAKSMVSLGLVNSLNEFRGAELASQAADVAVAEKLVSDLELTVEVKQKQEKKREDMRLTLIAYVESAIVVTTTPLLEDMDTMIKAVEDKKLALTRMREDRHVINESLLAYNNASCTLEGIGDLPDVESLVVAIEEQSKKNEDADHKIGELRRMMLTYNAQEVQAQNDDKEIVSLEASLPDVCPMCNGTGKVKEMA